MIYSFGVMPEKRRSRPCVASVGLVSYPEVVQRWGIYIAESLLQELGRETENRWLWETIHVFLS
jgi:hypothetical protein